MLKISRIMGLVAIGLVLGACTQQGGDGQPETTVETGSLSGEQLVSRRAEDRWQSLVAWDMKKAYGYLSPGTRQSMPLSVYMKKNAVAPMEYTGAVVKNTQCENQVCTLKVQISYLYQGSVSAARGQEMSSTITENWIMADGNWFYVPD